MTLLDDYAKGWRQSRDDLQKHLDLMVSHPPFPDQDEVKKAAAIVRITRAIAELDALIAEYAPQ